MDVWLKKNYTAIHQTESGSKWWSGSTDRGWQADISIHRVTLLVRLKKMKWKVTCFVLWSPVLCPWVSHWTPSSSKEDKSLNWRESQSVAIIMCWSTDSTPVCLYMFVHRWVYKLLCCQVLAVTPHQERCFPSTDKSPLLVLLGFPQRLFSQPATISISKGDDLRVRCVQT